MVISRVPSYDAADHYKESFEPQEWFPSSRSSDIKYGSCACTHLMAWLCCAQNKCKIPSMSVQQQKHLKEMDSSGYWKPEGFAADAALADVMTKGLQVFVIKWPIRVFAPRVIEICSKADNLSQNNASAHQEHAVLQELLNQAELEKHKGGHIDFRKIAAVAFESNPPCLHMKDELVSIVQYCSGTNNKPLQEFLQCHRDFRPMGRLTSDCYNGIKALFPHGPYLAYAYAKYILSSCLNPYSITVPAAGSANGLYKQLINKRPKTSVTTNKDRSMC